MKINKVVFFIFLFVLVMSVVSPEGASGILLNKGNNFVLFNSTQPMYVSTLVKLNPKIEVVSFSNEENKTLGYVNFAGGIGDNFIIKSGVNYEIFTSENGTIILPQ